MSDEQERTERIERIRYRLRTGTWALEVTPELLQYVGMTAEEVGSDPWKI